MQRLIIFADSTVVNLTPAVDPLQACGYEGTNVPGNPNVPNGGVGGAYTGAHETRAGVFERAHGGTLFLDELGELPLELQPKLLRVLETREVRKVGGTDLRAVDVRVIAGTNRNLEEMVEEGLISGEGT